MEERKCQRCVTTPERLASLVARRNHRKWLSFSRGRAVERASAHFRQWPISFLYVEDAPVRKHPAMLRVPFLAGARRPPQSLARFRAKTPAVLRGPSKIAPGRFRCSKHG